MRTYLTLPDLPKAGPLNRYRDRLGVIVPIGRENLIANPSFETGITGWTTGDAPSTRVTSRQRRGAYSYEVAPLAMSFGGVTYANPASLTLATGTYAISFDFFAPDNAGPYVLEVIDSGLNILATYVLTGAGRWERPAFFYTEATGGAERRLRFRAQFDTDTLPPFYLDGVQLEACAAGEVFATTYIDGDQRGLVANQVPPAYYWTGTPHASTSVRSGQTRAGGRVMQFKDFGFLLTAIIGLGLAPPQNEALRFAQLDGGQYQNTIKPPRTVSLVGRWVAETPTQLDVGAGQLARLLDRDRVGLRQPVVLTLQAEEDGRAIGEPVTLAAAYAGGLEGQTQEVPTAAARMDFAQYLPYVMGGGEGEAAAVQVSVSDADGLLRRAPDGTWAPLSTGLVGAPAYARAMVRMIDGKIAIGGSFSDAGGSGADNLAIYDSVTDSFSVVGSATAISSEVLALALGPTGLLYVGGGFANAGGVATADNLATWNGAAWAAVGTSPPNSTVRALAVAPNGNLYIGGSFTDVGGTGADYVARWNGSAWSVLGSATALNAAVRALAFGPDGRLYVGGDFTNASGIAGADYVAVYDPTTDTWAELNGGVSDTVLALAFGADGRLYAGGEFFQANGTTTTVNLIAVWNGVRWEALASGLTLTGSGTAQVTDIAPALDGTIYVGGVFDTLSGIASTDALARWNGSAWLRPDVDLPGASPPTLVYSLLPLPDGTLYAGFLASGTATAAGITTVVNSGTAIAYPRVTIRGPSSGTSRIYQLVNITTGQAIYFNLTLNAGETAVLTLDPQNITFVSSFQDNILRTILPGSQTAGWGLQPGANEISFFAAGSTVTAVLDWQIAYLSLSDALDQVTP